MSPMKQPKKKNDRHKPGRMIRIPMALVELLDALGAKRFTNATTETVRFVREGLEREGLLPKPEHNGKPERS